MILNFYARSGSNRGEIKFPSNYVTELNIITSIDGIEIAKYCNFDDFMVVNLHLEKRDWSDWHDLVTIYAKQTLFNCLQSNQTAVSVCVIGWLRNKSSLAIFCYPHLHL